MDKDRSIQSIGIGAAAGLIGTAALKTAKNTGHPERQEARSDTEGTYRMEPTKTASLGALASGSPVVAVYSAIREEPRILRNGLLLGLGIWGIAKLGWLPAARLDRGNAKSGSQIGQHLLFGIALAGAYRKLNGAPENRPYKTENR